MKAGEKDFYRNLTVAKLNEEIEAGNQFVKEINEVEADMVSDHLKRIALFMIQINEK